MKVHQITEAERIEPTISSSMANKLSGPTLSSPGGASSLKSVDIKPGILDAKGNKTFSVVDQDGKVIKRFSGPSAEAKANEYSDKLKKQIKAAKPKKTKPQLTGDPKKDLAAPKGDAKLKADNAELKARLDKIEAAQKEASKGFFRKWVGRIVKYLAILPGVGVAIQTALNVPQLEDAFDAYLRSLADAGMTDPSKCKTIGVIVKGDKRVPQKVAEAYTRLVELTVELLFEVIIGVFTAATTPAAYAGAAALFVALGITSGGVTVVLALIAGGAWLIGGPALIRKCFAALGVMEALENLIGTLAPLESMCRWANIVDDLQALANVGIGKPMTGGYVDDLFGESATIVEKKSSSAIKSDLEKIIKSDPEILAAYKKGKKLKPKFDAKLKAD
ncbi:hypothetical protein N9I97_00530 [bacterium]|nr:hypothetical protein [bacterium]